MNVKPLNISVKRAAINNSMYYVYSYDEYCKYNISDGNSAVITEKDGKRYILPIKGKYENQCAPGIYDAGCIDISIFPIEGLESNYIPEKIVQISNKDDIKNVLDKEKTIARLSEPWITSPDSITYFPINEEDHPEMVAMKTAFNEKKIDFDKYASRFGPNFPNDKRQMKNDSLTLNMIKRFCDKTDIEAILVLKDKDEGVPNPIGREISVSLTEDFVD
jgi:hypothetical protein